MAEEQKAKDDNSNEKGIGNVGFMNFGENDT